MNKKKVLEMKRVNERLIGGDGNCMEDCAEFDFCICATRWKTFAGEGIIIIINSNNTQICTCQCSINQLRNYELQSIDSLKKQIYSRI